MTYQEDTKRINALRTQRKYCKNCGHSMTYYQNSRYDKLLCNYCGNYIYKNDLIEFKEKLKKCQKEY